MRLIAQRPAGVTVRFMGGTKEKQQKTSRRGKATATKAVGKTAAKATVTFEHLLPKRISPSRASDYDQCPKLFYYKTILGLSTPASVATCKGTLAHYAFEKIFDHPRDERTPENAILYVRQHWEDLKNDPEYAPVVALGEEKVETMLLESEELVKQWFSVERPWNFDPQDRELYVAAEAAGVSVHGYIDRVDTYTRSDGRKALVISDYKTGKPPMYLPGKAVGSAEYYAQGSTPGSSLSISGPYIKKAFFGLNVYALLLWKTTGVMADKIRLIYVQRGRREDVIHQTINESTLRSIEREIKKIWTNIVKDAKRGEYAPKPGPLCTWCHFEGECPARNETLAGITILNRDGEPYPR